MAYVSKLTIEGSKYYTLNLLYLYKNQNNMLTWALRRLLWCMRSYFIVYFGQILSFFVVENQREITFAKYVEVTLSRWASRAQFLHWSVEVTGHKFTCSRRCATRIKHILKTFWNVLEILIYCKLNTVQITRPCWDESNPNI